MTAAKVVPLGTAWPFPAVTEDRWAGGSAWFETTEQHLMDALCALPPVYFPGGFFMGEPAAHDERGVTIYSAWVRIGERCFVREFPQDRHAAALAELRAALASEPSPAPGAAHGEAR